LPAGAINNVGWFGGAKPAPAGEWSRTITVQVSSYDVGRAAYLLVREFYIWYGHAEESIPYTTGVGDNRVIDIAGIKTVH